MTPATSKTVGVVLQPVEAFVRSPKYLIHFAIGMLLLVCLVYFDRPLSVSSLAQSNDDEAIRRLVGRLFESYQQKNLTRLLSLWGEKSPFLAENKKALQKEFDAFVKIAVKGFDVHQMKIDGDKATLRVVAEIAFTRATVVKPAERIEKKNRTIEFVKETGIWKVWKFISSEEDLAAVIIAAKTKEEWKALMEKEPELITSDLAASLISQNGIQAASKRGYQHALGINELAYKLAERIGDQLVIASALLNAGRIYGWVGTPEKSTELALEYLRKSLKIGEEFGFKDITAISLVNSAGIYFFRGDFSQAAEYYQICLKLAEELRNQEMTMLALNNLGVIHRTRGNYAKSLELQLKYMKLSESRLESGADWVHLSRALNNIGLIFSVQGNYEQALVYFQRSNEAADRGMILGEDIAKSVKADVLLSMGRAYVQNGNHSLALEYYDKSLELIEEIGYMAAGSKENFISGVKMNIGDLMAEENNTLQAITNYEEALELLERTGHKAEVSYPLYCLGKMYLVQGDYREALVFLDRAVKAAEEIGNPTDISNYLVTAAKAYQKLGKPEDARQALYRAIDLIEQLREQFAGGELDRQLSFENYITPYQAMIDFQVDQKRFTEAFSCAQLAKGRTLLELLQNGRVNIAKSASPAEREQEQQLSRKIGSLNRQVTDEKLKSQPDENRLAGFEEQLKKARLEFEAFQTTLYAAHPELKVQRGEIRPVSFDDAPALIPDSKTALLDFIVADENLHLFVLTKDASAQPNLNTYTIKIERKALAEKVERFRRRMENRDYDFQALSQELYVLLLKPAEKQLQGKTNLILSPDNVLWDLPFQVLLSPELRYLIEDAAISYVPSLSVLREMRLASKKNQPPAKASILALGNPALGTRSKEVAKFVKMDAELQPLPEAAAQVQALERLYGKTSSKVFTGRAAREGVVKEKSARYRILHLATHGILNDVSPMYSHVMLSQTPGKPDEDGLLEAWEMMNLDLNADLVVLSACETARGRVGAGEGVIGMSWALFVAGCPRTVVSQWKVEASSTTVLMMEFHKRFKTRYGGRQPAVSTAEAMRQAALKVMRNPEFVHPFYWGGFVVIGDGN
jgi:CHAT domain-containing protein/tetratricopeptide (TPR) repeat protein